MSAPMMGAVTRSALPASKDVRDLLEGLLGKDVDLKDGAAWSPTPRDNAVVAEFVDDRGTLQVLTLLDLPLAGFLGAALGLLPPGGAKDMVKEGRLSPMVVDNVYEGLNIATSLFNRDGAPHVRITEMHGPGGALPAHLVPILARVAGRQDLTVSIAGYGPGRLGFVLA